MKLILKTAYFKFTKVINEKQLVVSGNKENEEECDCCISDIGDALTRALNLL